MDGSRFDNLTKRLAQGHTRRRVLHGLAGGITAAAGVGLIGPRAAGAFICREPGVLCAKNAQCCSGTCDTTLHRCTCASGQPLCGGVCCPANATCVDGHCQCGTDYQLCSGSAGLTCCPTEGTCTSDGTCACLPSGTYCSAYFGTCDFCCAMGYGCNVQANTCQCL